MKKHVPSVLTFAFSIMLALSVGVLFTSSSGGRAGAADDGNIGAPGEGANRCGSCHNGGSFGPISETLTIADGSGAPITEYVPGTTYRVSYEVAEGGGNPMGYGFQLTALDAADQEANDWSNETANVQIEVAASIAGGRTYIEQNGVSSDGLFEADWTAPAAGTGPITFYYAGNVINGNSMTSGDNGGLGLTTVINEAGGVGITAPNSIKVTTYPNPISGNTLTVATDLNGQEATVELFNMAGQSVFTKVITASTAVLDLPNLQSGVYLLSVNAADKQFTGKVIRQ